MIVIDSFSTKCLYLGLTFVILIFVLYNKVFINFITFCYCSIKKIVEGTFIMVFMRRSCSLNSLELRSVMISIFISMLMFRVIFIMIERVIFIGFIF